MTAMQAAANKISIHAPHARSDLSIKRPLVVVVLFQSTLLMRGATSAQKAGINLLKISTHAPLAWRYINICTITLFLRFFNQGSSCV